jgi:protein tyrosine/serine phosphatase
LRVLLAGLFLVPAVAALSYVTYRQEVVPRHWGRVKRHVLYRSAQPDDSLQWDFIHRRGIRTVVNLCFPHESPAAFDLEHQACAAAEIRLVSLPIGTLLPSDDQVRQFIRTVRSDGPVLVHCQLGRGRTGIMVAAYRILLGGRSAKAAWREMRDRGWGPVRGSSSAEARQFLARLERDRPQWLQATAPLVN